MSFHSVSTAETQNSRPIRCRCPSLLKPRNTQTKAFNSSILSSFQPASDLDTRKFTDLQVCKNLDASSSARPCIHLLEKAEDLE